MKVTRWPSALAQYDFLTEYDRVEPAQTEEARLVVRRFAAAIHFILVKVRPCASQIGLYVGWSFVCNLVGCEKTEGGSVNRTEGRRHLRR